MSILFRKKKIYYDKVFIINKLKLFIRKILNRFDINIVRLSTIENDIKKVFKDRVNDKITIFDIGAYTGNSVYDFRNIFKNSLIYSFEPSSKNYKKLIKNTEKLKNVFTYNIAVSSKEGKSKFYENEWEFTSSLLKINEGKYKKKLDNSFKYRGINHSNKIYEVKTTSIDKFIENNQIEKIDIIKIDTQGNEEEVLKGMKRVLKNNNVKIIIIEMIFADYYEKSNVSFMRLEKYLLINGYKIFGIYGINKISGKPIYQLDVMYYC
jgi:FkbM family methyltransferase